MNQVFYKDFALKARCDDPERMRVLIHEVGAIVVGTDEQCDTYFKTDRGKLKWRKGTIETSSPITNG